MESPDAVKKQNPNKCPTCNSWIRRQARGVCIYCKKNKEKENNRT